MTKQILLDRIDYSLKQAETAIKKAEEEANGVMSLPMAESRAFTTSSLSLLLDLYGNEHPYYIRFKNDTRYSYKSSMDMGVAILRNVRAEVENNWLSSIKSIVSAEIFSDFLDMALHLLENNYEDASAVMIGSVLEQNLRKLCLENDIPIENDKQGKLIPVKAEIMNQELAKRGLYNKLVQKSITANLDLRNKAAHGHYDQYDRKQVEMMYSFVLDLVSRY